MSDRLNPKLTKRSVVTNNWNNEFDELSGKSPTGLSLGGQSSLSGPSSDAGSNAEEASEYTSNTSRTMSTTDDNLPRTPFASTNPRRHLLHNGKWIAKKFELGRPVRRTGLWSCCGHDVHFSLYCHSLETRQVFKDQILAEINAELLEEHLTKERKVQLQEEIQRIVKVDAKEVPIKPRVEEVLINAALETESNSFQAPMLIQWLLRHQQEEPTMLEGLEFLLHHLSTVDGCILLQRHAVADALLRIYDRYPAHTHMQLLIVQCFKQLLSCNFTRAPILSEQSLQIIPAAFQIAHRHMNSAGHVEAAVAVLQLTLRFDNIQHQNSFLPQDPSKSQVSVADLYEQNSRLFWTLKIPSYLLLLCRRYVKTHVSILRSVVTTCLWLAKDTPTLAVLFKLKIVKFINKVMKLHARETELMRPCVVLLSRLAPDLPEALAHILELQMATLVLKAMQLSVQDDELTLTALRLLQMISRTSEGFGQLNNIKNGWQMATQGTMLGDALVHSLPGPFQNPGWALGDTPYLPELERMKLQARSHLSHSLLQAPTGDWTVSSLRQFMGHSMEGKKLAINNEHDDMFFELIVTLDLLPRIREEKEAWFMRLRQFERENDLMIEEMIATVLEMRKRDVINKQMQKEFVRVVSEGGVGEEFLGSVKPLYVRGEQITTKLLEERDQDIAEALQF